MTASVKDNICVPTIYAIPSARKWLDDHGVKDVKLIVMEPGIYVYYWADQVDMENVRTPYRKWRTNRIVYSLIQVNSYCS